MWTGTSSRSRSACLALPSYCPGLGNNRTLDGRTGYFPHLRSRGDRGREGIQVILAPLPAPSPHRTLTAWSTFLVRTGNVNVQSYINKAGGVRNVRLAAQAEHFLGEALADGFHLQASRLTSKQYVVADRLSRPLCDSQDGKLHPANSDLIERWVGTRFDIDAFATELDHQVAVFFSKFPQPGSAGVDALL